MLKLACSKDLGKLGIRNTQEGLNISAFLDHLEICEHCGKSKDELMEKLNELIGGAEGEHG